VKIKKIITIVFWQFLVLFRIFSDYIWFKKSDKVTRYFDIFFSSKKFLYLFFYVLEKKMSKMDQLGMSCKISKSRFLPNLLFWWKKLVTISNFWFFWQKCYENFCQRISFLTKNTISAKKTKLFDKNCNFWKRTNFLTKNSISAKKTIFVTKIPICDNE